MQSTTINMGFCRAQNYQNSPSFKAKFSKDTINRIEKSNYDNYLEHYKNLFFTTEKIDMLGSKDTTISIEEIQNLTRKIPNIEYSDNYDTFYGFAKEDSEFSNVKNFISPKTETTLKFTHPLFKTSNGETIESLIKLEQLKDLSESDFLAVAKDIDSAIVEQGEENLAIAYVKDLMEKLGNKGSLVEASKDIINKLEKSNFSKKAIEIIKNATKSIDLRNKLDSRITKLLKI